VGVAGSAAAAVGPLMGSPLAVEDVQPLIGDEGVLNEKKAALMTPEAVNQRTSSASAYEGLSPSEALSLSNKTFPSVSGKADGGPPSLPEGQRVVGFPSDFAMSVEGTGGSREVREGVEPIAFERTSGQRTPIDLGLSEVNGPFQPKGPLAPVSIPKHLAEGVALPAAKVTVAPVDEHGNALPGDGVLDGVSVFYGATESAQASVMDLDTIVKPSTFGLTIDQSLRSQRSPSKLFFKVGLPEGATLAQEDPGSGPVRVVVDGRPMVVIFTPSAEDAQGSSVPVSMSVDGDTLVLTVEHPAGAYAYPIMIDPRYEYYYTEFTWDEQLNKNGTHPTNWHFEPEGSLFTDTENGVGQGWTVHISGSHGEHELGDMVYTTQGASHIWTFASETAQLENGTRVETLVKLEHKGAVEEQQTLSTEVSEPKWNTALRCRTGETCLSGAKPENGNSAVYESVASGAGTGTAGENILRKAEVAVQQEGNPEVKFDTTDETVNGRPNALYGTKTWLGPHTNALVKFTDSDKGIGIEGWSDEHTNSSGSWLSWSEKSMLSEGRCSGIQCPPEIVEYIGYSSALPDGEPKVGLDAWNALYESHAKENEAESLRRHTVRVDSTPPYNIAISGLGAGNEIGAGEYHLKAEATDGSGTTPSSGVKSLVLLIDGREVGSASGSCPAGPCTAHGEWTIAGRNYATGKHFVTVVATDNAGNTVTGENFTVTVRPASPVSLGPGSLNPQSGELTLTSTDVSMGGGLTVSRSFDSRHVSSGTLGAFGAQWGLGMGGQESLVKQPNGSMVLTDSTGAQTIFATDEKGGFISPAGDSNLTLSTTPCEAGKTEDMLKDAAANTTTCFAVPSGGSGEVWVPSVVKGTVAADTVTYVYETAEVPKGSGKKIVRPKEALAPVPVGVTCSLAVKPTELKHGCRVLTFNYATTTTATGEAPSQWGDYEGQMTRVYYTAYDPAPTSKTMHEVAVAHYLYDQQDRLRTKWDPRISPELKTFYGYDAEGHVTALTAPGRESWAITYGSSAGDSGSGRALKVIQAPASAALWSGELLKNTEAPRITGSPAVGVRLTVSDGRWSGGPVTYGYQWEDCNFAGGECSPIRGATNANYTPSNSDVGHTLVAVVSATNGGGSVTASGRVVMGAGTITESSLPSGSGPLRIASGSDNNLWFTENATSKIGKITTAGTVSEYALPSGSSPWGITSGPDGNLWFTDYGTNKIGKITTAGTATEYALPSGSNPSGITSGPDGNLWFTDYGTNKIGKITTAGTVTEYALPSGSHPYEITSGPDNNLWFTNGGTSKIGKITTSGTITEYALPSGSGGAGIVSGPDNNIWFAEHGKIGKITTSGAITEYALPSGADPYGIVSGSDKNLWFTSYGSNKVGKITTSGTITEYGVPSGSGPAGIAPGADGNVWFVDYDASKISKIGISGAEISESSLPSGSGPLRIASGSDNSLWFTENSTSKIGKITTAGTVTEYALPSGSGAWAITSGSDKNLWFTDSGSNKIGKITTGGAITEYALPSGSTPEGITSGADNNLWFADYGTNKIGKITTSGTVTEYALPSGSHPYEIASGPDNNLWFTNSGTNKIGKITTSGTVTEYALPSGSSPHGITAGPDGDLWFAEYGTSKIGKITTSGTVTEYGLASGSGPYGIIAGSDKNMWYTSYNTNKVGKITTSGTVTEYGFTSGDGPAGIASGSDNNLWFVDYNASKISKVAISGTEISESSLPSGSGPLRITSGSDNNLWFTEINTSKIGKITTAGTVSEYGLPSSSYPRGITSGPDNNLWFADSGTNKIGKITTSDTVTEYALPSGSTPEGITSGSDGNLWFADSGTNKIGKITTSGAVSEYALPSGSKPYEITSGPDNNLWFTNNGTSKIGKITTSGTVTEYALPSGSTPGGITSGPDNNIWFAEHGKIGKITTSGTITEYALPSGIDPYGIVSGADKNLWFTSYSSNKVGKITTSGTVTEYGVPSGSGPAGIASGPDNNLWFVDYDASKIGKIAPSVTEGESRGPAQGSTVEYNVPLSGTGLPNMTAAEVKTGWGQEDAPVEATAIFPPDEPQGWPAGDYKRATISYVDAQGRTVNVATPSGGISTNEYNTTNDVTRTLSADNRATALKEGAKSAEVAKLLDTQSKYNSEGTELTETLGPRHLVKLSNGKEVQARSRTAYSYDEGAPTEGGPYRLVTKTTQGAQVEGEAEQDVRTVATSYAGQSNLGWKLRRPTSVTADPSGLKITHTTLYDETTGNVLETRMPKSTGAESPHDTKTVYYSAAVNTSYPACGEHPEWASLPCERLPGKQPETPGLPALPVTTVSSYNMWFEPLTVSSTSGSATRTTTGTYDEAGRPLTSETTSSVGTALPKVTDKYDEHTGAVTEESTMIEGKTQSLKSIVNAVGQVTSYTDADGNTSTFEYETEKDARLKKVNDGKGAQTYEYNETTGAVKEIIDSAAGTFTPGYDVEGNMTSQNYPNGMKATYTLDAASETTSLVYKKETHCTENCEWFKDSIVPSIHGQWASQTSSLSKEAYTYNGVGWLTEAQATPTGKGCTTRRYAYDEDTNRTSLTTYEPNSKGECSTEKSVVESHTYDPADRLTDTGAGYDAYGNTTSLPAADAGKFGLTSSFYQDNQLQSQTQNGQTIGYNLDPAGRTREIVSTGKVVASEIQHYAGPGNTPAWTGELSGNWTRNIPSMSGLSATQHDGETPILQLTNLHGDIVATAADSETATGLAPTTGEASEYGVPATEAPPKYSWLGASEIRTELPSGVSSMGARSYIPQLGRFLQADPMPGGSSNPYAYTNGDPINETDLTGAYVENDYVLGLGMEQNTRAIEQEAAREAAIRKEAEERAREAAIQAKFAAQMAAELAEAEARNLWNAEAAAGPQGGGEEGTLDVANQGDFVQCKHEGCSQYCVEHAKSKAEAIKCGGKGNWHTFIETIKEIVGIAKCAYEVYKGGACPNP
jgi:RHS repeat-associated protein